MWAEGEQHKRQRQILAPIFTTDRVKAMSDEIYSTAHKLVGALQEHIQLHAENGEDADEDKSIDAVTQINALDWTSRATLDIIGSIGFGYDFHLGTSPEAKAIISSWRKQTERGMTLSGFIAPFIIRTFPFITSLPVKAIQAQGEAKMILKGLARTVVQQRQTLVDGGELLGKDLLSTLLSMKDAHGESFDTVLDHVSYSQVARYE